MKCPFCGYSESKVIDSRPADEGASHPPSAGVLVCAKRFTTYETVESLPHGRGKKGWKPAEL